MKRLSTAATIAASLVLLSGCEEGDSLVRVRLVAEHRALVPGERTELGVNLRVPDGWHTYWNGRSDSGAPLSLRLEAPRGYEAGAPRWPAPKRLVSAGDILDHVYDGEVTVIVPVVAPRDAAPPDSATFVCVVEWVACRDICVAGTDTALLTLPIARGGPQGGPSADAKLFEEARRRLPAPRGDPAELTSRWESNSLVVEGRDSAGLVFYPASDCGELVDPIHDAISDTGRLTLRVRPSETGIGPVKGILEMRRSPGTPSRFIELDIEPPEAGASG
jgi:thiol:disulfide interchange protein DsbD